MNKPECHHMDMVLLECHHFNRAASQKKSILTRLYQSFTSTCFSAYVNSLEDLSCVAHAQLRYGR